ncbi:MAG: VOC family protein [Verrucomicrobia bacterium]|nr:VOC family protein [Verrucomicrobiota bacterium]
MFPGWISLRVKDPKEVAQWYSQHLGLEVLGGRHIGGGETQALGSPKEKGPAMILLPGQPLDHPERLQMHFAVPDVDDVYERMKQEGVRFDEPPADMPWGWRHAYTRDPAGHTVEICSRCPTQTSKNRPVASHPACLAKQESEARERT